MAAKKPVNEVEYKDAADKEAFSALVGRWWNQIEIAKNAAALELQLRNEIFARFYPEGSPERAKAGSEHFGMPGNWVLKIDRKINAKIDRAALDVAKRLVLQLEADEDGVIPSLDGVITYKPELSDSGYRDAHPAVRKILAETQVLEFNPGTPQIKLELPKSAQPKATPKDS